MQIHNYTRAVHETMVNMRPLLNPAMSTYKQAYDRALELMLASEKFILPDDGVIFGNEFKGLPDVINLPYPKTVLEFKSTTVPYFKPSDAIMLPFKAFVTKCVVVAEQIQPGVIWMYNYAYEHYNPASANGNRSTWVLTPYVAIVSKLGDTPLTGEALTLLDGERETVVGGLTMKFGALDDNEPDDFYDEAKNQMVNSIMAVLSIIEVLSCSNVTSEVVPARKQSKSSMKSGALPFDDYRVIKVRQDNGPGLAAASAKGNGRERREHLRRGHIRRYPDKKIFVQACVVNAGKGGFITKDYIVPKK